MTIEALRDHLARAAAATTGAQGSLSLMAEAMATLEARRQEAGDFLMIAAQAIADADAATVVQVPDPKPTDRPTSERSALPWCSGVRYPDAKPAALAKSVPAFEQLRGARTDVHLFFTDWKKRPDETVETRTKLWLRSTSLGGAAWCAAEGISAIFSPPAFPGCDAVGAENPIDVFRQLADGRWHDAHKTLAQNIKATGAKIISIRPMWEWNSPYPWSLPHVNKDWGLFKQAFRACVAPYREVMPDVPIDFCSTRKFFDGIKYDDIYPGDDVVSFIGVDWYGTDDRVRDAGNMAKMIAEGTPASPRGLASWFGCAAEHGKPLAVAEWAVANLPRLPNGLRDSGEFIRQTWAQFERNAPHLAYECYFNGDSATLGPHYVEPPTANPRASAAYAACVAASKR